jgi:hypothetical protein
MDGSEGVGRLLPMTLQDLLRQLDLLVRCQKGRKRPHNAAAIAAAASVSSVPSEPLEILYLLVIGSAMGVIGFLRWAKLNHHTEYRLPSLKGLCIGCATI